MPTHRRLVIVGGGIGGMATGLALTRAGIPFVLYEQAPAYAEVGAGISLWPNATRVLKAFGVLDRLVSLGEPIAQFNLMQPGGKLIAEMSMDGFDTPALCVHRADLHRCLRDPLPADRLEGNQRLLSYSQGPEGIAAHFASGLEIAAPGLIGADGINSVVRAQLHGEAAPIYRGYCIWRGIAEVPLKTLRGHISETWGRGSRFGILPMGQGRVCWYATRNGPPLQADGPNGRKDEIYQLFKGWHSPIPELVAATDQAMILKTDARDRRPLSNWGKESVTLVGDAAHPITPNVGQGACLAIEDAACLAKCLMAAPNVAGAFRAYETMRKRRTAFVGRQARRIGAIGQWENPWVVMGRNFITGLVLSHAQDMRLNAVYAYEV